MKVSKELGQKFKFCIESQNLLFLDRKVSYTNYADSKGGRMEGRRVYESSTYRIKSSIME